MQLPQTNIHDAFFKKVLSQSEMADTFLREHLPREFTDLLFRLRLKTGGDALAYVLVEHKSAPDKLARLQLLRYIVRVLVNWHETHDTLPLPPVVPLLAHQGPGGWKISTEFRDLYGTVPESLRPYLISFRHALVDLAQIEDSALSAHFRLRSFLRALKYVQRKDLSNLFERLLLDAEALDNEDIEQILSYVAKGPVAVSMDIVQQALHRLDPSRKEHVMKGFGMVAAQPYIEQGIKQGLAEAKARLAEAAEAKGHVKGQAKALIRVLKKRFGRLPPHLHKLISAADVTSIEVWLDRAIDALDLQSVFEPEPAGSSRPREHETH